MAVIPQNVQDALDRLAASDAAKDAAVATLSQKQQEQATAAAATEAAQVDLQAKTEARSADYSALITELIVAFQD